MSTDVLQHQQHMRELSSIGGAQGTRIQGVAKRAPTILNDVGTSSSRNDTSLNDPASLLHESLHELCTLATLPISCSEKIHTLIYMTMQAMSVDLCVLLLPDGMQKDRFTVHAFAATSQMRQSGLETRPVTISCDMWEKLHIYLLQERGYELTQAEMQLLNPLVAMPYEELLPVPLCVGDECVGLLNCYSYKTRSYTSEELLLLRTIASQAAMTIKLWRSTEESEEETQQAQQRMVASLFDSLLSGDTEEALLRHARLLGCDLAQPYAVVLMQWTQSNTESIDMGRENKQHLLQCIMQHVTSCFPGSLLAEQGNMLCSLLCLGVHAISDQAVGADAQCIQALERISTCYAQLIEKLRCEQEITLSAGVSDPGFACSDFARAYTQATEALTIGQRLAPSSGYMLFRSLGLYRYIYPFVCMGTVQAIPDWYQQQISSVADYDRHKKTHLLDTLETYLEYNCNIAKTAAHLEIHRNTLLQRLDRLKLLCSLSGEQDWIALLLALKVYRLQTPPQAAAGS